jgi:hypothetical protein
VTVMSNPAIPLGRDRRAIREKIKNDRKSQK